MSDYWQAFWRGFFRPMPMWLWAVIVVTATVFSFFLE